MPSNSVGTDVPAARDFSKKSSSYERFIFTCMKIYDTNNTEKRLTVTKENKLTVINNVTHVTLRISSKAILVAFVLSVINMFV